MATRRKPAEQTRRRRRRQRKHAVDLVLQARDISKLGAAVKFRVRSRGEIVGTIEVGQGGLRWSPRNGKYFRRMRWERFFERIEGN